MSANVDLKQIQRKAWRSLLQDGFLDISWGLSLLGLAVYYQLSELGLPDSRSMFVFAGIEVVAVVVYWAGFKFVSRPRLGRVRFGACGKAKQRKACVILAILMLAGAALFGAWSVFSGSWAPPEAILGGRAGFCIALGLCTMVILSMVSYFMDFTRGYVIGAFYALGVTGALLLNSPLVPALAGAAAVLMGLVVLARFLRQYPPPDTGESGDLQ
jgi:hypothetical protein